MQQNADIYLLQSDFAVNTCILLHLVGFLLTYINNFTHNILIKTIKNDTFKQSIETTVLIPAFTGNGKYINQFSSII